MKSTQYGFTLIELLVAVAIISGLAVVLAQSFFSTTRSSTKAERLTEVKQNGDYALGVLERMIRNARTLTASCTSGGTQATPSIAIVNPDGFTTTFQCLLDGSVTRMASVSSVGTEYLTGSSVTLGGASCDADTLNFYCTSQAQIAKSVKVTFQLSQKGLPMDQFEKASTAFQIAVTLRQ